MTPAKLRHLSIRYQKAVREHRGDIDARTLCQKLGIDMQDLLIVQREVNRHSIHIFGGRDPRP